MSQSYDGNIFKLGTSPAGAAIVWTLSIYFFWGGEKAGLYCLHSGRCAMSSQSKLLVEAMLRLSLNERAALIDTLIMSLDKPDAALDEQWLEEAERRMEAYRSGKLGAADAEDVFKEMDAIG
jgi:putative addiction module component (TIGR02574 family)